MPFEELTLRPLTAPAVHAYAPRASGVYGVANAREWIYIGETDNIQGTLLTHLLERETWPMKLQPTDFVFEVCDRVTRPTRQDRLVLEYEPFCNRRSPGHPNEITIGSAKYGSF
jgi:hypothetical protein